LVGILLAGNVALGMGALVLDVGLLYVEREQLQSGADAGSLAVAAVCAERPVDCTQSEMDDLAEADYADANAADGLSGAKVCGRGLPGLDVCDSGVGNLTDCLTSPSAPISAPYVEVRTSTQVAGGKFALPPVFAGTIIGYGGTAVAACSRVSWGPAGSTQVEPAMAISRCYWATATSNGSAYQPRPTPASYEGADPDSQVSLKWQSPGSGSPSACGGLPDGFGWFAGLGGSCRRTVEASNWYSGRTDASNPSGCASDLVDAFSDRRPVSVAIIDQASPSRYHVVGIARFVVTGWFATSSWSGRPSPRIRSSPLGGSLSCLGSGPRFCVFGYFTTGVLRTGTGTLGDDHYGAVYLKTIG
jgi:hypothetical protein